MWPSRRRDHRTDEGEGRMSGPIWRRNQTESVSCDSCLKQVDISYNEGTVEDGTFVPRRRLCDECYRDEIPMLNRSPFDLHRA
jgi:hypothetical protein